ncbi:MAG TPA: hypothetical protein VGK77_10080 [Candidatus Binatia bacterium]
MSLLIGARDANQFAVFFERFQVFADVFVVGHKTSINELVPKVPAVSSVPKKVQKSSEGSPLAILSDFNA